MKKAMRPIDLDLEHVNVIPRKYTDSDTFRDENQEFSDENHGNETRIFLVLV